MSDEEKLKSDDDITNIENSPTISSKRKTLPRRQKKLRELERDPGENIARKNIFKNDSDVDTSVIDCTPETNRTKTDLGRNKVDLGKKKGNNSSKSFTLTQMFTKSVKRKVKPIENNISLDNEATENYYEENSDDEQMQISDLLNFINKNDQNEEDNQDNEETDNPNTPNK